MEENVFYSDWLNDRYPYDSEARNKKIQAAVLAYLKDRPAITLVDVGAGTGSNCLYWMDKMPQDQTWIFIEKETKFRSTLLQRLQEYAAYHKYEWHNKEQAYSIITPKKKLSFQIINASLLEIDNLVSLPSVDVVLANAVFDLFSEQQVQHFLAPILRHKVACYFTLNYASMEFVPEDPFDSNFVTLYEQHMERVQEFGPAMGKRCSSYISQVFEQNNWAIEQDKSDWHIQREDIKMHYYLLNFLETALMELELEENMRAMLPKWIQRKKELVITRKQELTIRHMDIFSHP